jgi:Protein of unknown function (DUF559)
MYEEMRHPFTAKWAREAGFGAKSLFRVQQGGQMVVQDRRMRLLDAPAEQVATLAVGPLVALGRRSAAHWYGWPLLTLPDETELVVPGRRCPTPWPGARIIRQSLTSADVVRIRDVPTTRPLLTAIDLALHLPLTDAVAVLDGACRLRAFSAPLLRRELCRLSRPKADLVADLVDPARASVYESMFAVMIFLSGVTAPVCQYEVRRGGLLVGRPDFAWLARRLIVEIDGYGPHSGKAAFIDDRRRQNRLSNAGWRVLRYTPIDLLTRPEEVIAEVRAALAMPLPKINASMIMG